MLAPVERSGRAHVTRRPHDDSADVVPPRYEPVPFEPARCISGYTSRPGTSVAAPPFPVPKADLSWRA